MHTKNNLLTEQLSYEGDSAALPTRLRLYNYNADDIQKYETDNSSSLLPHLSQPGYIHWLQIYGLRDTAEIEELCTHFGINFLLVQDILNTEHPCKIEEYDNYNIIIAKYFDKQQESQASIVQGTNFVLTFMEYETDVFQNIEKALSANVLNIRTRTSDYLLTVLLNSLVANYISLSERIDDELDDLESELLREKDNHEIGAQIQSLRRQYLQLKRTVLPLKEQYTRLIHSDSPLIHKANHAFFNDLNDHFSYLSQNIGICRETLSSLVDLYISNNDLRMNAIMKRLTIVSTIFIPLSFLAGVWGMNFEFMPELKWAYGYPAALTLMAAIGIGAYLLLRRKKWN